MMRIITGKARGTRLATLAGDATRPTAERTKEAVFSMLGSTVCDAVVLDLFAGSGQLGLEALSRGAARAVFCDRARASIEVIRSNAEKTHLSSFCKIQCAEYDALLRALRGKEYFDLVFLDPPYALHLIPDALRRLSDGGLLTRGARIVCESADGEDVFGNDAELAARYTVLRVARYGAACVTVLSFGEEADA